MFDRLFLNQAALQPQLRLHFPGIQAAVVPQEFPKGRTFSWPELDSAMDLDGDSSVIARDLPSLGEVMVMTRNEHAVLASFRAYPQIWVDSSGLWGGAPDKSLACDFGAWTRVSVLNQASPMGPVLSLEIKDQRGEALHRVCLTGASNKRAFYTLVQLYSRSKRASIKPDRLECLSAPWKAKLSRRFRWLGTQPATAASRVHRNRLLALLQAVHASGMPVRWQLLGKAVNQTHCGSLEFFEPRGQWWFGGDHSGGIHLHPRGIESLWLLTLPCSCCGREEWTLEAYDSHERLVLTLRAGNRSEEEEWRSLLLQIFPADSDEVE